VIILFKNLFFYLKELIRLCNKKKVIKLKSKEIDDLDSLTERLSEIKDNPISNEELEESAKSLYREYIYYISESPSYKNVQVPDVNDKNCYIAWQDTMGISELKGQIPNDKIYYMLEIKRRALKKCLLKESFHKYN
jgi:hypothetical protein